MILTQRSYAGRAMLWGSALFIVLTISAPILWALLTSLKLETKAVAFPPVWIPDPITLSHYVDVVRNDNFLSDLWNSVLYSVGAVALSMAVGVPAGYAAARLRFRGKQALMLTILGTSMVPGVALLVPTYILLDRMGLLNDRFVIIAIMAARLAPQTVWFVQNFVQAVPVEMEEAAFVDGATRFQVLRVLVVPLIKPGLAAISVLGMITTWNDYVTIAVFAPDVSSRTLQVALVNQVFDTIGISWSYFMSFAIVASAPVVLIFMVAQRLFVAGLTAGTVKG